MKINLNDTSYQENVEFQHKKLEAGFFGKLFGTGKNATNNIAGMVLFILLFTLVIALLIRMFVSSSDLNFVMEVLSPIITLTLGYLFGRHAVD